MRRRIILIIIAVYTTTVACLAADAPTEAVLNYIHAVLEERWNDARNCWDPVTIEASERLGIDYTNIPLKFDCASPVMYRRSVLNDIDSAIQIDTVISHDLYSEVVVSVHAPPAPLAHRYCVIRKDTTWVLQSPLLLLSQGWNVRETEYARICYADDSRLNSYACNALDTFIQNTGQKLGITGERLQRLGRVKIPYYLCSEDQFERLTGHRAHGLVDLPLDAIVSRHLPHKHEVTHLLINYAASQLGLFVVPFMQEGTAVHFGGRWERSPETIRYMGAAIHRYGLALVENLLTHDGFHNLIGNPDISYPISGLLVESILDQPGVDFIGLYRRLSGTSRETSAWNAGNVIGRIEQSGNVSWEAVEKRYRTVIKEITECGVAPGPVILDGGPAVEVISEDGGIRARIRNVGESYGFEIDGRKAESGGVLLLNDTNAVTDSTYISLLFGEHLPNRRYNGEVYGIKFSPDEIGVYDYLSDELIAIFVPAFSGNESATSTHHYDTEHDVYRFTVSRSVFRSDIHDYVMRMIAR